MFLMSDLPSWILVFNNNNNNNNKSGNTEMFQATMAADVFGRHTLLLEQLSLQVFLL